MTQKVSRFVFNSFGVNTYVLSDDAGRCLIIDPACQSRQEESTLANIISSKHLQPVGMVNTHFHLDHIVGNTFVRNLYNLKVQCHKESKMFWETAPEFGSVFGIKVENLIIPTNFLADGDQITFGNSLLQVLYTPGHADGSICLVMRLWWR